MVEVGDGQQSREGVWRAREAEALERLNADLSWYYKWKGINRWVSRSLALVILVCAVLAPVTISSTDDGGLGVFGIHKETQLRLSLALTLVLALAEGLRRTYKFEERYATCLNNHDTLRMLRDTYLDAQVDKQVGSPDWVKSLEALRQQAFELLKKDNEEFVRIVKGETPPAPASNT